MELLVKGVIKIVYSKSTFDNMSNGAMYMINLISKQ
jgi:hypothetical protein